MADINFIDNSIQVSAALAASAKQFLIEAGEEIRSAVARGSRRESGQLAGSWKSQIVSDSEARIGSPLENAILEEFGTGEYAVNGGRSGGWYVHESKLSEKAKSKMRRVEMGGEVFYFTRGKTPSHALQKAFDSRKAAIIKRAEQIFKVNMS